MNEFKINDFLCVKLEDGQAIIFVNDEPIDQCKYLLLNISRKLIDAIEGMFFFDPIIRKN